jgi:hypothetical protein
MGNDNSVPLHQQFAKYLLARYAAEPESKAHHEVDIMIKVRIPEALQKDPDALNDAFYPNPKKKSYERHSWLLYLVGLASAKNDFSDRLDQLLDMADCTPLIQVCVHTPLYASRLEVDVTDLSGRVVPIVEYIYRWACFPLTSSKATPKIHGDFPFPDAADPSTLPRSLKAIFKHLAKHNGDGSQNSAMRLASNKYNTNPVALIRQLQHESPTEPEKLKEHERILLELWDVILEHSPHDCVDLELTNRSTILHEFALVHHSNENVAAEMLRMLISSGKLPKTVMTNDDKTNVILEKENEGEGYFASINEKRRLVYQLTPIQLAAGRGTVEILKEFVANNIGGRIDLWNTNPEPRRRYFGLSALHLCTNVGTHNTFPANFDGRNEDDLEDYDVQLHDLVIPSALPHKLASLRWTDKNREAYLQPRYAEVAQILLTMPSSNSVKNRVVTHTKSSSWRRKEMNPLSMACANGVNPQLVKVLLANGCTVEGVDCRIEASCNSYLESLAKTEHENTE